ncbi:dynamin family protein [Acetobacterium woodii]|uniref:Dynamin N-terminal domain-containing protein n=1 Tax=Acetobacterium woodii (strain ATCC 29683 / DSM 1030 / JCM 2381 / KCTC 1655 / WB1) TaxID=931626 RepID=H6LGL4_ACEWD|nr:dynamin family protein [Acetobacterium woodii]AFA48342.1 hypothetical protein Awo_c15600 [Acetobacterium woodii DSM 1030]
MQDTKILSILKEVEILLSRTGISDDEIKKVVEIRNKIENNELVISVIGQFKRGKTSLINALLGADVLPIGVIPVTSVATKIQYGEEGVMVHFKNGEKERICLNDLIRFVAEQENPNNQKGVSFVNLYLPFDFLRNGLVLVDTPGVGSVHQNNTDEAYAFMKKSDAIIFMLSVDSPINEIEYEFLVSSKKYASKFYFTVNKIDTISCDDLNAYLNYCRNILREIMSAETIALFPISAKTKSGMNELLGHIEEDIQDSTASIIIDSVKIKLRDILKLALDHLEFYRNASNMPLKDLEQKREELISRLESLDQLAKESTYYLQQQIDELLEEIRIVIHRESEGIEEQLIAILNNGYEQYQNRKTKILDEKFRFLIETDLSNYLINLNDQGLETLVNGYDKLTELFNNKIDAVKDYLENIIFELFGTVYHYKKSIYKLSQRDDFYVRIKQQPVAFLVDINDFIYLMPRGWANKKIYSRYQKKIQSDVEHNVNNMIYNYQYKLKESVRELKYYFQNESESLKREIEDLINQVIDDKKIIATKLSAKLEELDSIYKQLEELLLKI